MLTWYRLGGAKSGIGHVRWCLARACWTLARCSVSAYIHSVSYYRYSVYNRQYRYVISALTWRDSQHPSLQNQYVILWDLLYMQMYLYCIFDWVWHALTVHIWQLFVHISLNKSSNLPPGLSSMQARLGEGPGGCCAGAGYCQSKWQPCIFACVVAL